MSTAYKYFTENSYEENKAMHTMLCKRYHPDNQDTGSEDMMKEINAEWELYKNSFETPAVKVNNAESVTEQPKEDFVMFKGRKYTGTPREIFESVALRYGGLDLQELTNNKDYEDYCDRYDGR